MEADMAVGYGRAADFLDPVLSSAVAMTAVWNPAKQRWQAPDDDALG